MMKKNTVLYIIIMLDTLLLLSSCTDDDFSSTGKFNLSTLVLQLPEEQNVGIATRALDVESTITDLFVVLFRKGIPKFQTFANPTVTDGSTTVNVTDFNINDGETVYVFCNTGMISMPTDCSNIEDFLASIYVDNTKTHMPMYGFGKATNSGITISLQRTLAKATVSWPTGYAVTEWKVCNVPSQGFITAIPAGYPDATTFDQTVKPYNGLAYFIPRIDNSTATKSKTYLLVNVKDQGWYKLDFYNNSSSLNPGDALTLMNIQSNTHYKFEIIDVQGKGYDSENEAAANDGCNILYDMTIESKNGVSNGQYGLLIDRAEVILYPIGKGYEGTGSDESIIQALTLSALIPNIDNEISTYTVTLETSNNNIKILTDENIETTTFNLKTAGVKLTTENSSRTIRLKFTGANVEDAYLIVQLGNITKKVPIRVVGANCYLADFKSATNRYLYIPVQHANQDGIKRIDSTDDLTTTIVWTDQPNVTLSNISVKFDKDKQWIEVTNKDLTFTGNVVIAVLKDGVIKWSWHLWCLDDDIITWDADMKVYDFKSNHENKYNSYTFMDRNLGATTLNKDGSVTDWGLLYQWGRKDPFPSAADGTPTESTIYHEGPSFKMTENHPVYGECWTNGSAGSTNNLELSIENPMKFIIGGEYFLDKIVDKDWYTNDIDFRNENLWIGKNSDKAAYNPCPIGWSLPKDKLVGPWASLNPLQATKDMYGLNFSDAGYFSFSPIRGYNGTLEIEKNLNNRTSLWWGRLNHNSVIIGTDFTENEIFSRTGFRSEGRYVRCIREIK